MFYRFAGVLIALAVFAMAGCSTAQQESINARSHTNSIATYAPNPTYTTVPTPEPTNTAVPTATHTNTPAPTATPEPTPIPTATPRPTGGIGEWEVSPGFSDSIYISLKGAEWSRWSSHLTAGRGDLNDMYSLFVGCYADPMANGGKKVKMGMVWTRKATPTITDQSFSWTYRIGGKSYTALWSVDQMGGPDMVRGIGNDETRDTIIAALAEGHSDLTITIKGKIFSFHTQGFPVASIPVLEHCDYTVASLPTPAPDPANS